MSIGSMIPFRAVVAAVACAVAAAGCGATTSNTQTEPPWAASLGPEVTVFGPEVHPGTASPGGVFLAYVKDLNAGKATALCGFVEPAAQALCRRALAGATSTNGAKFPHVALGYVIVNGDEALVGLTGTFCHPGEKPTCTTNTDPAAILSSKMSFAALFRGALASQNPDDATNSYSLGPFIRVDSRWYIDVPLDDL
jgi:hypothetical protein